MKNRAVVVAREDVSPDGVFFWREGDPDDELLFIDEHVFIDADNDGEYDGVIIYDPEINDLQYPVYREDPRIYEMQDFEDFHYYEDGDMPDYVNDACIDAFT